MDSNPWSTNDDSEPSTLVADMVLIRAPTDVPGGVIVVTFGVIVSNCIFCVAPTSDPPPRNVVDEKKRSGRVAVTYTSIRAITVLISTLI